MDPNYPNRPLGKFEGGTIKGSCQDHQGIKNSERRDVGGFIWLGVIGADERARCVGFISRRGGLLRDLVLTCDPYRARAAVLPDRSRCISKLCTSVVSFVDMMQESLPPCVCAWTASQNRRRFSLID